MFTTVSFLVSRLPELGDHRAWELFERRYTPMLKRYFRRSSCAEHVATDLAQDTIQRVAEGLREGRFNRGQARLRDWIGGIARNVLRNHRRRPKPRTNADELRTRFWESFEDAAAAEAQVIADDRFDAVWVRMRLRELLRVAAENFDRRELRCYFLAEVRGLPIKVIAERTGLSETSVFQKRRRVANWLLAVGPRFISRWEL